MKSIAKVFQESKNTSLFKDPNHQRGWQSEQLVIEYFQKQNYQVREQRFKTPFAEVDLVLRKNLLFPDLLVEVKSIGNLDFLNYRVSAQQKKRLLRSRLWYQENFCNCQLALAIVCKNKEVLVLEDFFS